MSALTNIFKPAKVPAPVPLPNVEASAEKSSAILRQNLMRNRVDTILTSGQGVSGKRTLLGG